MQQKNLLLFLVLSFACMVGFNLLRQQLWPAPERKPADQAEVAGANGGESNAPAAAARGDGARLALGAAGSLAMRPRSAAAGDGARMALGHGGSLARIGRPPAARTAPAAAAVVPPTPEAKLIRLGRPAGQGENRFNLLVDFDPRGAGVRRLIQNRFAAADKEGRPVWKDRDARIPEPLELIPGNANRQTPAFALYHFDPRDPSDDHPLDTLGHVLWSVVGDKDHPVVDEKAPDGRLRQRVTFQTEVAGVTIRKSFTLTEGDYHLGLEVSLARKEEAPADKEQPFRYQLAGAQGLPVEGVWYTSTFRNALIARVDQRGNVERDLQDLRQIIHWEGGKEVLREQGHNIRYAGVALQYFASVIAVDNEQKRVDFLVKARPTLETAVTKGRIKSIAPDHESFVLAVGDRTEITFHVPPGGPVRQGLDVGAIREGGQVAVVHRTDGTTEAGKLRALAEDVLPQAETQPLWIDDITVRVATEPIDLKPGMEVVHKYVLYNGPSKVMLLGQLTGAGAVPPDVVSRYENDLFLNTLTDYHSPGVLGEFASSIYWSQLIIKCTNVMHGVLNWLHGIIPNYGVCIILLTVLVRAMMFPVSRKQALTSIRMQELAPELKKLQEKHKDDRQALQKAQWEMYQKQGVSPFGSCWLVFLQMPIFMGLYYCLQESIHFRLAEFWPTWIINLAAPDMLFRWGERIPVISSPDSYGGMFYLGPYLNLLPVIAVTLMILQQKYTMPPPTDEQQEVQQKVMKFMMIFFGLMFYKVAAGLCMYFIASSLWGFAERKLLPKKKPVNAVTSADSLFQRMLQRREGGETVAAATAGASGAAAARGVVADGPREARPGGRRKKGRRRREDGATRGGGGPDRVAAPGGLRGWWQNRKEKLAAWWEEVLRQAEKKR